MNRIKKTPFHRRFALVYPKFQLLLLSANLVILITAFTLVMISIARSYAVLKSQGLAAGMPPDHSYFNFLHLQAAMVYRSLAVALGVCFFATGLVTLWLSNKLAGPIVRLKEYFGDITNEGKFENLKFRKGDFFNDLPDVINSALARLGRR